MKEALNAFFLEQDDSGLWDKGKGNSLCDVLMLACAKENSKQLCVIILSGQPIYKSFRKTGRNVGNAFVFATDTLGSLLDALPAEYFRPHLGKEYTDIFLLGNNFVLTALFVIS